MEFPSNSVTITAILLLLSTLTSAAPLPSESPTPTPWPPQFHSILVVNFSGSISLIDLWYDWPNGRNYNIVQDQLDELFYDVEWNNGSVYKFHKDVEYCRTFQIDVGILRPNWLDAATYLGQETIGGFLCNVWTKADFIWYYEDVVTKRPVHWVFYTGRTINVMTFEVGAVLEDAKWQAPAYCFQKDDAEPDRKSGNRLPVGYLEPETKDVLKGSMQFYM